MIERADAPWLDPEEQAAWRALIGATKRLMASLDVQLQRDAGLPFAEYEVLVVLSESPGQRMRMSELADWLHLSPSGLTRRLDRMVRSGMVRREQCPSDRRGSFAVLTPAGYELLQMAAPGHVRAVREHFVDRMSRDEIVTLGEVLARMSDPWMVAERPGALAS